MVICYIITGGDDVFDMAKYHPQELNVPGTHLYLVYKGTGYFDISKQIMLGNLKLAGYKAVVLLVGCVDVLN